MGKRSFFAPTQHTRALLRLERTMNLLEGGTGGEGRMGERGWGGDGGRVGREGGEGTWGREGRWGERGRVGREGGWERGRVGSEGGEVGEGRGGEGRGGMTVIHIVIGMFTSNTMEQSEQDWSMEFNSDKCEVLRITRKGNPVSFLINYIKKNSMSPMPPNI